MPKLTPNRAPRFVGDVTPGVPDDIESLLYTDNSLEEGEAGEKGPEQARLLAVSAVTMYVAGQLIGLWVVVTRDNAFTKSIAEQRFGYPAAFVGMILVTDILYCYVMYSDPGRLPQPGEEGREVWERSLQDYPPQLEKAQWCKYCETTKLLRAKHCHQCGVCVAKFDHHCFWIYNCVGAKNHCAFWWLLLCIMLTMGWGNSLVWHSYTKHSRYEPEGGKNVMPTIASFLGIPMWIFVFAVFVCHTIMAGYNCTTWEYAKREKIPYLMNLPHEVNPWDQGCLPNWLSFCCTSKTEWRLPPEYFPNWV